MHCDNIDDIFCKYCVLPFISFKAKAHITVGRTAALLEDGQI